MVALVGFLDNTVAESTLITEDSGSADYYINNQTGANLNAVYARKRPQSDSLKAIPKDSLAQILRK